MKTAICIFLVIATSAVYWQVQDHEFINYDDEVYVIKNLNVKAGFTRESFNWAFTTSHFANWHPMTWLSYMLDYQFYGMHPKGYHLTNLLFHIANALLLFMVLLRMTGALWQSGFVAVMFALHPLNVESVAWVAERKNVLSTLFWLLTMWAYVLYVEKPSIKRYSLTALFFALGLMAKPMLVTLPFVLLMVDYWPLRRLKFLQENNSNETAEKYTDKGLTFLRLVYEKVPLFLLAGGASIVTFIVQKGGSLAQSKGMFTLQTRLINAMVSYLEYLEKTLWPKGLAIFYPHPGNALALWEGMLCGILLVGISAISIRLIRKAPYFAVGWFWYLGTLVPVIGIVQVGTQAMADRYAYIPLIGIFIIAAWGLPGLTTKSRYRSKVLTIAAVVILIPALMMVTWRQVGHWKNSIAIFEHAVNVTDKTYPGFADPYNNLGIALSAQRKFEEAISYYQRAIQLNPTFAVAYYNLGNALSAERKFGEAISYYKVAVELNPNYAEAYINFGNALFLEQKTEEAIFYYKRGIKLNPTFAVAYYNLGNALSAERKFKEAISYYETAIKLKPDYADANRNLRMALLRLEKMERSNASPLP